MPGYTTLLTALGWTLMNSFWQLAILWTLYWLITTGNKSLPAAGKHNLGLVMVTMGTGWVIYSFFNLLNNPIPAGPGFIQVSAYFNHWIPALSILYLLILTARLLIYGFQYAGNGNNHITGKSPVPLLQLFVDRHAKMLGITKHVQLYLSELVETAEIRGFIKPMILLPGTLLTRLTAEQLEAILIHELFHIRRNDYLINLCLCCFRSVFFFNPFARIFFIEISKERENACDDEVMERGYAPAVYAQALFCLEKFRQVHPGFSIAADGNKPWMLMERIRRVLGKQDTPKKRFTPFLIGCFILSAGFFGLQPQTSELRQVVSVSAFPDFILPATIERTTFKTITAEREIPIKVQIHHHLVPAKKTIIAFSEIFPETAPEPATEPDENPREKVFFAENMIARNYTNQLALGQQEAIQTLPGTPYLPKASISYEALPALTAEDSLRDIVVENSMQEMADQSRYLAVNNLKKLENEISENKKQLKKMELKNRQLIMQHRRDIKPLLQNIQLQLMKKTRQIEQLRIRIQAADEEIIHI